MQNKIEQLIKLVYRKWKSEQIRPEGAHPDEEALACFLEARLSQAENLKIKEHLIACDDCAQKLAIQTKLEYNAGIKAPPELLARVKKLLQQDTRQSVLEIVFRLKDKILELINTTGDILVGQELIPAPVLRSRHIKDFKDEVVILKDFADIRVEIKVENKRGEAFNLTVFIKEKTTQEAIKDLRITLLRDDLELESYHTDSGRVTFENVLLGKYLIQISNIDTKLASVILDIKI